MRKLLPMLALVSAGLVAALSAKMSPPGGSGWSVVPSPNASTFENDIEGVSCPSSSSCTAVGEYFDGTDFFGLIESWDGTSWSLVNGAPVGSPHQLRGVSCTAPDSCVAAGWQSGSSGLPALATLIEQWNGAAWSVVISPNQDTTVNGVNQLFDVSCVSPSFCVAVGVVDGSNLLIETWNGSSWSVTPGPTGISGSLTGISCTSPSFCMASGRSFTGNGAMSTLALSWNGIAWTVRTSPNVGAAFNELWKVSCPSPSVCIAAGDYADGTPGVPGSSRTLIEAWIGVAWVVVPSPNVGTANNRLWATSCTAMNSCVAVGQYETASGEVRTLVLSPNGPRWSVVPSASPGLVGNWLGAVSCTSKKFCMGGGGFWDADPSAGGVNRTLIEVSQ